MGERANRLEAQCHSDRGGVYAAGIWEESHASYPERSAVLPERLGPSQGGPMGRQKSAEAIVVHCIAGAIWLTGGRRAELVEPLARSIRVSEPRRRGEG